MSAKPLVKPSSSSRNKAPQKEKGIGSAQRSEFESLLLTLSNSFINLTSDRIDWGINYALLKIGEFSGVDRSWIIEFDENGETASNTFEWCAPGIESGLSVIQKFPVKDAPWFMEQLLKFQTVHIPSVAKLPPEAEVERKLCEAQDIKSSVSVPLIYSGKLIGIVGFDSVRAEKQWSQEIINLLSIVGEMVVNALHRKRVDILQRDLDMRFQAMVEGLAEGLVIGDNSDRVLYVNSRMCEMTGYSPEDLLGIQAYRHVIPESEWSRVEGGTARRFRGASDRYELTVKRKDGSKFLSEVSATPYRNSAGEIVGTIAAFSDLSAKKAAEQENDRLQRQLVQAQKMEAVGQLAAGVAHDLNNSLGAIVGHLQLIKMSEGITPQGLHSIDIALSGCDRASTLVNQLLSFSKQGKYDFKVVSIQTILNDTLEFLGRVISPRIEIKKSGQLEELYISADHAQLQQVLTNLIINAGHAMPAGGTLNFSFSTTYIVKTQTLNQKAKPGNFVVLTVSDTGAGIKPDVLPRIFDPFFTTKVEGEGSGLGLSMAYAIIQNHGGWIEVDSEPGMGSAFSLYFPQVGAPSLALVEGGKEPETPARIVESQYIVVIDDEPVLVDLACNFLGRAGFQTMPFTNPAEAIAWYREHSNEVSLILLDMKMPGFSGSKSFTILREINPAAQIVLISGYFEDAEVHQLLERGAVSFIQKPVKYSELVAWVSKVLKQNEVPARVALVH